MANETQDDYLARLNIEGKRKIWLGNHPKIQYVLTKSKKYLKPGMSICEIGIGDGYLLRLLNLFGLKCTGIDISNYLIKELRMTFEDKDLKINLLQRDIVEPIDCKNVFDVIFGLDILEHIKDLRKVIKNIEKLLKPRGILVATLPWKENLDANITLCPKCHHHFHRIGHFHSFQSYCDIVQMLGDSFQILSFDFIPAMGLTNMGIDFLKKTLFRKKYYKDEVPNFHSTCFFIAQCNKC